MLDTAQSSVTTWQTLKRGRCRGISKSLQQEHFEDRQTYSWSFVFVHIKKLSLKEREKRLQGHEWKGTPEPGEGGRGRGAASAQPEKEAEAPALQKELHEQTPTPISTFLQNNVTRIFPFLPALSKRNVTLFHNTREMKLSDSIQKTTWGQ